MNTDTTNLTQDLKDFINKEKQSNKVIKATVLETENNLIRVTTRYNTNLTTNTPIEVDRIPSKIIRKDKKSILIKVSESPVTLNRTVSIKNIQKDIIINKLTEVSSDINNNCLSKENQDTLDVLTKQYDVSFNDKKYKISPKLNKSQKTAVRKVLQSKKFHIVQGPPGSGKTHTIVEMIKHIYQSDKKILITTHTHVALDNIIERLGSFNEEDILRIGSKDKISEKALKYSLDEKIKNHPNYQKIIEKERYIEEMEKNKPVSEDMFFEKTRKENFFTKLFNRIFNIKENEIPLNNTDNNLYKTNNIDRINEIKNEIDEIRNNIQYDIVSGAKIIASTVLSSSGFLTKNTDFDYVIMDEASQVPVYLALIPLLKTDKFVLIGDNKQLQPIKNNNASSVLNKSIFNLLIEKYPDNYTFLNIQYRMNEKISDIASLLYYDNKLLTGDVAKNRGITLKSNKYFLLNEDNITFLDTSGVNFDEAAIPGGCFNTFEAEMVLHITGALIDNDISEDEIGIITPYRKQKNYIDKILKKNALNVECDTIYRFQGREKDVIIISFCKSSAGSLSFFQKKFLADENQLNVSITRSRKKLIVIGNCSMLCGADNIRRLVDNIEPGAIICLEDLL